MLFCSCFALYFQHCFLFSLLFQFYCLLSLFLDLIIHFLVHCFISLHFQLYFHHWLFPLPILFQYPYFLYFFTSVSSSYSCFSFIPVFISSFHFHLPSSLGYGISNIPFFSPPLRFTYQTVFYFLLLFPYLTLVAVSLPSSFLPFFLYFRLPTFLSLPLSHFGQAEDRFACAVKVGCVLPVWSTLHDREWDGD